MKIIKSTIAKLTEKAQEEPKDGISPPILILIAGVSVTGKSTLGKFLEQHL